MLHTQHPVPFAFTLTAGECDDIQRTLRKRLASIDALCATVRRKRWPASVKAATLAGYELDRAALLKLDRILESAYAAEHARTVGR